MTDNEKVSAEKAQVLLVTLTVVLLYLAVKANKCNSQHGQHQGWNGPLTVSEKHSFLKLMLLHESHELKSSDLFSKVELEILLQNPNLFVSFKGELHQIDKSKMVAGLWEYYCEICENKIKKYLAFCTAF